MSLALDIRQISKTFKKNREEFVAVDNFSFQLAPGKTLGLIGANGAGKSTTIKCILNLMTPSRGEISIFGQSSTLPQSRVGVAFVAENSILNDQLSAEEVVALSLRQHRFAGDIQKQTQLWLDRLGVLYARKKRIRSLSKGMAQRTALAAAFACEARLLILDEPLSGLDPIGRKDVVDLLDDYRQGGGTLLFTSHVLHDVERLADDYCIIHKGKLAAAHTAADISAMTRYIVSSAGANNQRVETVVEHNQLWSTLNQLQSEGRMLEQVKPELSLEKIFYDIVSQ